MLLKRVEIEQLGPFFEPVCVDGLGPGLNVLAGANEIGKSTLLTGLLTLFTEQHRTAKKPVRCLRPYTGGAPRIAANFELGGQDWTLEKRYLAAQAARLERADSGELCVGADAENRLTVLLESAGGLGTYLRLLWVGQKDGFDVPEVAPDLTRSFAQLLEAEVRAAAGTGTIHAVRNAVDEALAELVTDKGRPRTKGPYRRLLDERDRLTREHDRVQSRAAEAAERQVRLDTLRGEQRTLRDPAALAALEDRIAAGEQQITEASEARRHVGHFDERIALLDGRHRQARDALADFDRFADDVANTVQAVANAERIVAELDVRNGSLNEELDAARSAAAAAAERVAALRDELGAHELAQNQNRLAQLEARLARFDELSAEIVASEQALAGMDWPADALPALQAARRRLDELEARRRAETPRLKFTYTGERRDAIAVDGKPVAHGDKLAADRPLVIEIEGIGRIDVVPAAGGAIDDRATRQSELEAQATRLLAVLGAGNLAEAEQRDRQRDALSRRRELLATERDTIASGGRAQLVSDCRTLADSIARQTGSRGQPATSRPPDVIAADLAAAETEQGLRAEALDELVEQRFELDRHHERQLVELSMHRARLADLQARLEAHSNGDDRRAILLQSAEQAETVLNHAVRERTAWAEKALGDEAFEAAEATLVSLKGERADRAGRLIAVEREISRLEGMQERDFEDGAAVLADELAARLAEVTERVAATEQRIRALELLADELSGELVRHQREVVAPLSYRINDLARRLWPDACLPITSDMAVGGLERDGRLEDPAAVSAGTREQLAVISRLAYAQLLSEAGEALPIILDDPLVFTDDERLDAMFACLADASRHHQIILLTCHERSFEPLIAQYGAKRLTLSQCR